MNNIFVRHRYPILLGFGIFIFIYLFFTQIHPVYPYDLDDWKIMLRMRELYPSAFVWNPTRILPEFLMPRCGELAMDVVYPFTGDITLSICYVTGCLLATLITAYMLCFYRFLKQKIGLSSIVCVLLTLLFLEFHFLIFRVYDVENQHLFYSYDLTDHYFYTIPNIMGSILVLLFATDGYEFLSLKSNPIKKGFLFLALYLMIFSNLFDSIILSAFVGSLLLVRGIKVLAKKEKWSTFFSQYWLHISVVLLWLVSLAFEPFGGNANEINTRTESFTSALRSSVRNMRHIVFDQTNSVAVTIIITVILIFVVVSVWKKKNSGREILFVSLLAAVVSGVFLSLLGAMSFPYYLLRIMSVYAVPFFVIFGAFCCAAYLLKQYPKSSVALPFLIMFVFCNTQQRGKTFQDVQTFLIPNDQQYCYQVPTSEILIQNRRNIQTIVAADCAGRDSVTLIVPEFEQDGNWPLSWGYGKSLSRFLLRNHIISKEMTVKVERQPSANTLQN